MLILAGVAAVTLAVTITVLAVKARTALRPKTQTPLLMPAPAVAGGFPRQYLPLTNASARNAIAEFRGRFTGELTPGSHARHPAGLYREPGVIDPTAGSTGWIMYLGYNLPVSSDGRAAAAQRLMSALAPGASPVTEAPGKRGGATLCASTVLSGTRVAVCDWVTRWTAGAAISPVKDTTVSELSVLVARMRLDLQPG